MSEEEKAIEFLKNKTTNYSLSGEELHYCSILYYLIINLQKENNQLKEQLERSENARKEAIYYIEKFIPIDVDTILMREKQRDYLIEILDIDKGE